MSDAGAMRARSLDGSQGPSCARWLALIQSLREGRIMVGHRQVERAALFDEFSLERHVPRDHLLRSIDRYWQSPL